MWDRPDILNRISGALVGLAVVLALYGAIRYVVHLPLFPLRYVKVTAPVAHVTAAQIETIIQSSLRGNFFTLDLPAARTAFEKLPWVRSVHVRRQWPDRLEVTLEEHQPLARWGTTALVNTHGETFQAAYGGDLPVFVGPPGSAKEIAIQYDFFRRSLMPLQRKPMRVQLSARRAWEVRLDDGLTLELGRENMEARLQRFVASYDRTLGRLQRRIQYVDLRYPNGYAVRIPELKFEKAPPERRG